MPRARLRQMPRQQGECAINRERRQSSGREKISDSKKMDLEQKAKFLQGPFRHDRRPVGGEPEKER